MYRRLTKINYAILLLATILGSTLAFLPAPVSATTIVCGSTITASTTLKADIGPCSGNAITIGANNIVLNCAGRTISGAAIGSGIVLSGITKARVENCEVTGFGFGIYLSGSSYNTITRNTVSGNAGNGMEFDSSSNNNYVAENTANSNGGNGINLDGGGVYGNIISRNVAYSNEYNGFGIGSSSGNSFIGNTATGNGGYGFFAYESSSNNYMGNIATSNNNAGFVLIGSSYNTLIGNKASNNGWSGFELFSSSDGTPSNANALSMNIATRNAQSGFFLDWSTGSNKLTGNMAISNAQYGYLDQSVGSGTAGTANFYKGDICWGNGVAGSSPSGLGSPQH